MSLLKPLTAKKENENIESDLKKENLLKFQKSQTP